MINQKVRGAQKVVFDDMKFDSKLELFCYLRLKEANIDFIYQPTPFVLMDSFEAKYACYEHIGRRVKEGGDLLYSTKRFDKNPHVRTISYTPDFAAPDNSWILEVKGYATDVFKLRWKLFKQHLFNNNYKGLVLKPENQGQIKECVNLIKEFNENKN